MSDYTYTETTMVSNTKVFPTPSANHTRIAWARYAKLRQHEMIAYRESGFDTAVKYIKGERKGKK